MSIRSWNITLLFLLIGTGLYFNARNNPFHYDDHHSIQYNPHIRSLGHISAFFTDPHTFSGQRTGFMFRPVLLITYAVNYALGGQEAQGYRWFNLIVHVGCAVLLYLLALQLTGRATLALAAGLVFLVHPAHGELMNYISSRSDSLVSLFYLGGCWLAMRGTSRGRWGSLVAYAAGLLTKSVAITFPAMALLLQIAQDGWRRVVARRSFYLWLAILSGTYLAIIWNNRFIASSAAKVPRGMGVQFWTQIKGFVYYLWLFVMPTGLNVEHAFDVSLEPWEPATVLAGFFLVSLGTSLIWVRNKLLQLGGLWFVVTLLPASLVPLNILVSERRAYLASAGLVLIAAWGWEQLARRRPTSGMVMGVAVCLIFAGLCVQRNRLWSSEISLWEDAVRKAPGMHRSRLNLGLGYHKAGRSDDALRELDAGLQLKPDYADAWVVVGNIRKERGDGEGAEEAYLRALEINPALEGVYHNLGNIYFVDRRDLEKGIAYYAECLRRNEHFVKARPNLGQAYEALGRLQDALRQYELGIADSIYWDDPRDPELGGTWFNLARLSQRLGDGKRAAEAYAKAYALLSDNPEFRKYANQALEGLRELEGMEP